MCLSAYCVCVGFGGFGFGVGRIVSLFVLLCVVCVVGLCVVLVVFVGLGKQSLMI